MSKRLYYVMRFELISPLSVGSGESRYTDMDIQLDSKFNPIIPATAVAGVFRHYLTDVADELFGNISKEQASNVIFYDAIETQQTAISARDMVKMNEECKTAQDGAKFDMQINETGSEFKTVIELCDEGCNYSDKIEDAISALNMGLLRFGRKITRGCGIVKVTSLKKACFTLPDDTDKWLDFDLFNDGDSCYNDTTVPDCSSNATVITLELSQKGAIAIRSYFTSKGEDNKSPDYKQLSLTDGRPVIPGTSWSGAFRHRFKEFAGVELCNDLFGFVNEKTSETQKSKIYFSESIIEGYTKKLVTRTTVDRYTNGTKDGALFNEEAVFNGKTALELVVTEMTDEQATALAAVICDLDRGYLAVGGLTSVGRGLFSVERMLVNGYDVTESLKACKVKEMLKGAEVYA